MSDLSKKIEEQYPDIPMDEWVMYDYYTLQEGEMISLREVKTNNMRMLARPENVEEYIEKNFHGKILRGDKRNGK